MTIVDGDEARRVPLRVRHLIDGSIVESAPQRAGILPPLATDVSGQGVPLASEGEAARFVEQCASGQARWLALGAERRVQSLRRFVGHFARCQVQLAAALADDRGIAGEPPILGPIDLSRVLDAAAAAATGLPKETTRGLTLWSPARECGGSGPVAEFLARLIHGSAMIVLPSPLAPRAPFALAIATLESQMPDGAVNLVYAEDHIRLGLLRHPLVAGVFCAADAVLGYRPIGTALGKPVRLTCVSAG